MVAHTYTWRLTRTPQTVYSFDDTWLDTSLLNFNIDNAPAYLFSTIKDIMSVNPYLKVHLLPWSPVSGPSVRLPNAG